MTTAILLAAGSGRRLGIDEPKCLIPVRGRTLLERHLDNTARAGIDRLVVVVGHAHTRLSDALDEMQSRRRAEGLPLPATVVTLYNERYKHGSLVSLHCAAAELTPGAIWMDADVLYPAALLARLVESAHGNCTLLDARSSEQGEEMMLGARDGRVHRIGRRVGTEWTTVGESVGFFRCDAEGGAAMQRVLDAEVAAGRLDQEHEDALDRALPLVAFGYELVGDTPWTEIDFPDDVVRAEALAARIDG